MRLLVTRPEPDATALKAQLIAMGHEVLIEPLMVVRLNALDAGELDLEEAQALIVTSRNAIRALAQSRGLAAAVDLPVLAVGPGTAETARALGFGQVLQGPGDAVALIGFIAERAEVNAGPLVYLAGETTARDVGGELRRLGFHVQEPVAYATAPAERLSAQLVARLEAREVDGVLLLSPQTARTWARLLLAHGLSSQVAGTTHFCLSRAVARGLAALGDPPTAIASQPDLKALLALVARSVSNLP